MDRSRGAGVHPGVPELVEELRQGRIPRREFLRTVTLLGVSAATAHATVAKVTGAGLLPAARAAAPRKGGVLAVSMRVHELTDPATFDRTEQSNVARHVLEHLTVTGPDNITRPWLAERWEVSEDLRTWTLHLRRGVRWSNGDEFTARDVAHNFERWLDPRTASSNMALLGAMVSESEGGRTDPVGRPVMHRSMTPGAVEEVDPHTVRLHLGRPDLAIPEHLHGYAAAIVHRDFDDAGGDLSRTAVGTGPFELKALVAGEKAILVKRDPARYWGEEVHLDGIRYLDHGEDAASGLAALASGQVDLVHECFAEHVDVVRRLPGVEMHEAVTAQTGVARMQVDRAPFDDVRVRTAIRVCQDHRALLEMAHGGHGAPAEDHHVAPIHPEYAKLAPPRQDHEAARRLLREAGHPDGIDVTLDCKRNPPWEAATARALAGMCRPAGIRIRVNVLPDARYWQIWDKTGFGFTAWTHRPLGIMALNLAYRSGAPWNESHYANPAFDRELDAASATLDVSGRRHHMARLESMLQRDAVIAQPLWRSVFAAGKKRVHGYALHPAQHHRLNRVWMQ